MARAPLLQLSDVALGFGANPLFSGLDLVVQPGERLALVGRNGAGKSTLMKVMAGLVEADRGGRVVTPGAAVGYMDQDPDFSGFERLGDFAAAGLEPGEAWRVEAAAEGLKFDPDRPAATASGGERRRAALARVMGEAPELMLLDEPTNHLDIESIQWLESRLRDGPGGYVLISHDRALLREATDAVLWIDRGLVRRSDRGFGDFEAWREKVWQEEDLARHKLERKIRAEAKWAVEGISARRRRNQGRVRALADLRKTRADMIRRPDVAAMAFGPGEISGKKVIEAVGLSKSYGETVVARGLDLKVVRGDRIAFVGPNGVGKTSLIRLLLGEIQLDSGTVTHGTRLEIAVFDQARAALDGEATLWETLTGGGGRVAGRADQVMVRGSPKHVVGYLKEFLFDEAQARAPVKALSGGEKARLLLARLMARESNLLVLDEPTNDLDVETLDLLQELVADYPGTVLLVSHDRDFIDRVATATVIMEGQGQAVLHAGGWSDAMAQRGEVAARTETTVKTEPRVAMAKTAPAPKASGLSFTERHRLAELPAEIDRLAAEIGKLERFLDDPDLYAREPTKFARATEALAARQATLAAAEELWLDLAEKAEAG